MFLSKWARLKSQMGILERRRRKCDQDDLDLRTKVGRNYLFNFDNIKDGGNDHHSWPKLQH